MRKFNLMLAGLMAFMFIATKVQAQTTPGFYAGKWDVLIKGTPNGDVTLRFTLTEKDGKLDGSFVDPESKKDVPVSKIEVAEGKATIYFTISTYDVNLAMDKVDDTHIKGSLMGMFDSTGERVKP
ncbi:hypothetical protein [Mucilaginibacter gilvus]|uniref:Uncharacterized protein n=1 Tax=Mucilaginibacter gilvus TaxID=2305909 RepID=A0A3S3YSM0_9SPHI|nr:hypothetical protein [Mucilaginibacter gilvus]RWY49353.1 hypothetical protein EPL05_18250 [Mucilaginibacter gilvus]